MFLKTLEDIAERVSVEILFHACTPRYEITFWVASIRLYGNRNDEEFGRRLKKEEMVSGNKWLAAFQRVLAEFRRIHCWSGRILLFLKRLVVSSYRLGLKLIVRSLSF